MFSIRNIFIEKVVIGYPFFLCTLTVVTEHGYAEPWQLLLQDDSLTVKQTFKSETISDKNVYFVT